MDIARTASARRLPFRDTKEVPFRYCPSAMERLALAADQAYSIAMEVAFAYAHPFLDGNDRTARVLCCWPWRVGASGAGGRGIRARDALLNLIPDPGVTRGYPRSYLLSEQGPAPRGESRVRTARSRPPHVAHKAQEEDGRRVG